VDEGWITDTRIGGGGAGAHHQAAGRLRPAAVIGGHRAYVHGGGWVLGNAGSRDRLVRGLAVGAQAALGVRGVRELPEARYATAS